MEVRFKATQQVQSKGIMAGTMKGRLEIRRGSKDALPVQHSARARLLFLMMMIMMMMTVNAVAQDGENIYRVGSGGISGNYLDVKAYSANVAYYTNRFGLVVMDITDPENPHPARIMPTRGNAQGLFLKDSLLFLCDGYEGLRIFDVNDDPWSPSEISHTVGPTNARGLEVVDNYAYLWQYRNSIGFIYDISDPAHPEELSRTDFEGGEDMQIHVFGDRCYVVSANMPVTYWDVSNPQRPDLLGVVDGSLRSGEHNTVFRDRLDFVISHRTVYQISDSLHMDSVSYISNFAVSSKKLRGDILFGTGSPDNNGDRNPGISIFDFSRYRQPQRISFLWQSLRGGTRAISRFFDLDGGQMFTCDGVNGTTIFDVSEVANPTTLGSYDNRGDFSTVAVSPGYIYAANRLNWKTTGYDSFRLRTYSRHPIASPEEVFALEVSRDDSILRGGAIELERPMIIGDRLYGITNSHFTGFTLEDPARPRPLFSTNFDPFGAISDFVVDGDIAFGVSTFVFAIDFSDYHNPRLLSRFRCEWAQGGIACDENYLYVHSWNRGLYIYNRNNERQIEELGYLQLGTTELAWDILLYGDRAYLVMASRIIIVNISDRQNPFVSGEINPPGGSAWRGSLSGDIMFVSCLLRGVYAYSLEDPDNPQQIGYYDTPGNACQAMVQDGYLYVADSDEIGVYDVGQITGVWDITLADSTHDFGEVGFDSTAEWTLELANHTDHSLQIDSLKLEGACFGFIDTTAFSIEAGGVGSVTITFTPDTSRTYEGCLRLFSMERELDVSLTGEGVPLRVNTPNDPPIVFSLSSPYPNPFNSTIEIKYALPHDSEINLTIYDLYGREIIGVVSGRHAAGNHKVNWDGRSSSGSIVGSGVYFVRLKTPDFAKINKITMVK